MIPLSQCTFEEYKPERLDFCFELFNPLKRIVLRAQSEIEMHEWLNVLLKHKLIVTGFD